MNIIIENIKRRGTYISLGPGITAKEGWEGNMKTLKIRVNGKVVKSYRGSSLGFGSYLGQEDKLYLKSLCE